MGMSFRIAVLDLLPAYGAASWLCSPTLDLRPRRPMTWWLGSTRSDEPSRGSGAAAIFGGPSARAACGGKLSLC